MKTINILTIISFIIISSSCGKEDTSTFSDDKSISGYLYNLDTVTGITEKKIMQKVEVFLTNAENKANGKYLYRTLTDNRGHFTFSHRPEGGDLYILSDTIIENINYYNIKSVTDSNDLILYPKQSDGLKFTVFDDVDHPLNNMTVIFYSNLLQAKTGNETLASYIGKTNIKGIFVQRDIPDLNYYVRLKGIINTYTYDTIIIVNYQNNNTIQQFSVVITPKIKNDSTINITVNDLLTNMPINGISLCIFLNEFFATQDTIYQNCAGALSIDNTTTNNFGKISISNLPSGSYFISIHDSIGDSTNKIRFKAFDTINYLPTITPREKTIRALRY